MKIQGLHHITLVSSNAQRTVDFYVTVLGLRLIKQTVNFDDPSSYHLYFGDAVGTPGTAITFFEWTKAPRGYAGIGGTHHLALTVKNYDGLLKWKRRLTDLNVRVSGPYDRHYFQSIYFRDPDGVILEIATAGPGFTVDEAPDQLGKHDLLPPAEMVRANRDEERIGTLTWGDPVPVITADMALIQGMHHISAISSNIQSTHAFLVDVLGLQRVKKTANFDNPDSAHWYWGVEGGRPGSLITYFEHSPSQMRRARIGYGQTHHFAFAVEDETEQEAWRERLMGAGYRVSQILDRDYFRSIYTNDPDGHIVELATRTPGFTVDEAPDELGQRLQLPAWLEQNRTTIENGLTPLVVPQWTNPLTMEQSE
ncbi:MAG: VOC family protein [Anaerolineae bacterium]